MASKQTLLVTIICLLFISSLTLYPVFNLALFGDDWLVFSRYLEKLGPTSTYGYNHITYFFTLYGPFDILMGQLYKVVGFNAQAYHLVSYIFRLVAALSIFPITYYLTKSRLASTFAVVFVAITPVGFDSTNWVFNMPAYLSIACLALSLYFYLKSHQRYILFIPALILFFLAVVIAPIRMSAALPIILVLEVYYYLSNRPSVSFKKSIFRSLSSIFVMYLITKTGSFGSSGLITENINAGVRIFSENFAKGRFDIIFYPLISFGSMLVPDFLLNNIPPIFRKFQFINWQISLFIIFTFVTFVIDRCLRKPLGNLLLPLFQSSVLWNLIIYFVHINNLDTFSQAKLLILLATGGYLLIYSIFLFFRNLEDKNISLAILLSLMLMLLTFFVAWGRSPATIYETTHRYLIVSSMGMALFLAILISLNHKKGQIIIFVLVSLVLLTHIFSTRLYLRNLQSFHGIALSNKIWQQIPYYPELKNHNGPFVFYFTMDDQSSIILHNVVTFGFPPHMGLLHDRTNWNTVPMDEWKELESAVTDGFVFKKYGFDTTPIPISQIYSFHLQNKDELVDITEKVRRKLEMMKEAK